MNDKTLSPTELEVSPYQPPSTPIIESFGEDKENLAGRWIRLLANLVDGFIFLIPMIALSFIIPFIESSNDLGIFVAIGIALIIFVVAIVVINLILLYKNGQTMGKRFLSIKIVRTDGSHVGLLRIIFLRFLPTGILSGIPFIGYLFALLDPLLIFQKSRRCLHDLIADTIVIDAFSDGVSRRSTAVIIAVSIIPAFIIIGILAAIAIPAYSDYMKKSNVAEAMMLFAGARINVESYMSSAGKFPSTADLESQGAIMSSQYATIESNPQGFYLQATMTDGNEESSLAGKIIRWTFEPQTRNWICSTGYPNGVDEKYLPRSCRS
ncbi:Zinc finger/thioredoxin [Beggiatoa sp. PS]|nr:Zinc finger/thioredoxin [Beggiatoa sp. PS]